MQRFGSNRSARLKQVLAGSSTQSPYASSSFASSRSLAIAPRSLRASKFQSFKVYTSWSLITPKSDTSPSYAQDASQVCASRQFWPADVSVQLQEQLQFAHVHACDLKRDGRKRPRSSPSTCTAIALPSRPFLRRSR